VAYVTFKVAGEAPPKPAEVPAAPAGQAQPELLLSKTNFAPGETVKVKYIALDLYASNAWIGIIPSHVSHGSESENDRHDLSYKYLQKSTAGEMTFKAPSNPGTYDFRMHDTDSNGVEVASITFTVVGAAPPPPPPDQPPALRFGVGDPVMVLWGQKWWRARVIATRGGKRRYKIHYDGYGSSWDEWVGDRRIRRR
jgi:hypothetical protein